MGEAAKEIEGHKTVKRRESVRTKSLELMSALQPVKRRKPMPLEVAAKAHYIHVTGCPHYNTCLHQAGLQDWEQVTCHRCGIFELGLGEMISYLKDGKLPEEITKARDEDPGLLPEVECLQAELTAAHQRIKKLETEMPKKKTDAKMIKAWLLANKQQLSYQDIAEKLEISGATASNWVTEVNESPNLLREAKAKFNGKPAGDPAIDNEGLEDKMVKELSRPKGKKKEDKQQAEINYLRWSLEGERSGFVDRMLEELGKSR